MPGGAIADGAEFELFANERAARSVSLPVRIAFENGQGLLAGQTQLRYRGVPVGLVEEVNPSNSKVEVVARLEPGYDILRREGTIFSLVRPRISLEGVSGLESLVSGVYIECVPVLTSSFFTRPKGKLVQNFVGRSSAAAAWQDDQSGLEVVITASTTSIGVDAPVYYRGLRVGKVERKTPSSDGRNVGLIVSIDRPYSYLIRENTKFWDASGLKASLGFLFVKVPTETLESLVRGGLAFATPDNRDMGAPTALEAYRFLGDGKEGKGRVRGEDSLLERVTAAAEERQLSPNSPGLGGPGLKSSRGRGPKASPSKPSRQKGWGSSMRRRPWPKRLPSPPGQSGARAPLSRPRRSRLPPDAAV